MELTIQSDYYSSTAYDSSKPKEDNRKSRFGERVPILKGGHIQSLSTYLYEPLEGSDYIGCREFSDDYFYRHEHNIKSPLLIRNMRPTKGVKRARECKASRYTIPSSYNPAWGLNLIAMCGFWGAVFGAPLGFLLLAFLFLISKYQTWDIFLTDVKFCVAMAIIGYVTYLIFNYLASLLPDKKSNYLDRRTGMITFSKNLDKEKKFIPFADCDPYLFQDNTSGRNYHLLYVDRYRGSCISQQVDLPVDAYVLAAYLKEFMDISKPLPDVPDLEAYRDQDPVTAEYDKKIGRDPRYWRDMSLEELKEKVEEKRKKLRFWFGKDMVIS